MTPLRDMMVDRNRFLCGVELVTTRGTLAEAKAVRAREIAASLSGCDLVDWISITDNAGGNPNLSALALAKPILHAGKEVVIHLSCKDFNRNGLESQAWQLASEGFHNLLAVSGDYPAGGFSGDAKPVFDIDSIGLLTMLSQMNRGLDVRQASKSRSLLKTSFFPGCVVNNFKLHENEVLPQLLKLQKKIQAGAQYVVAQIGYNARKSHELKSYLANHQMRDFPIIGNVFLLNLRVASVFRAGRIPGVLISDELFNRCTRYASAPDRGQSFFIELAAKQVAMFRGLGFRGVYLGGVDELRQVERIMETANSFSKDDWKSFIPEVTFWRPDEFYLYTQDPRTRLADPGSFSPQYRESRQHLAKSKAVTFRYRLSKFVHKRVFSPGTTLFKLGKKLYTPKRPAAKLPRGPWPLRVLENACKSALFGCKDCGDCSLPDIAFLCPESSCAKNQRNGPCGGTRDGLCEVRDVPCIWGLAYDRLKYQHQEDNLLAHTPVIQDQRLRGTSSWGNCFLGKDHNAPKSQNSPELPPPKEGTLCPLTSSAN